MIACVCFGITDEELKEACARVPTIDDVIEETCAGNSCERCIPYIRMKFEEYRRKKMHNAALLEGITILSKYLEPEGMDMCAEHDEIFFGGSSCKVSPEDAKRLKELGWDKQRDFGWHAFV